MPLGFSCRETTGDDEDYGIEEKQCLLIVQVTTLAH